MDDNDLARYAWSSGRQLRVLTISVAVVAAVVLAVVAGGRLFAKVPAAAAAVVVRNSTNSGKYVGTTLIVSL